LLRSRLSGIRSVLDDGMINVAKRKEELFKSLLVHKKIRSVRSFGLWLAVEFDSFEANKKTIDHCIAHGVLTDWFLFASNCLRISPPLIISEEQIKKSCAVLLNAVN